MFAAFLPRCRARTALATLATAVLVLSCRGPAPTASGTSSLHPRRVGPHRPTLERTLNWPGFRGWNADGIGDGRDARVDWDLASADGVLWSRPLAGLAHSSPIVWGDLVILTTAIAEGMDQFLQVGLSGEGWSVEEDVVHSWSVVAFDKTTGQRRWVREVGRERPMTRRHFKATQANSTPVTDGRYIVAVFPTAGLACLDMAGNIVWHHPLGGLKTSVGSLQWGFAASPVIYGSSVILQVDTETEPHIAAWDLASGELLWRTERSVQPSWSTPTVVGGPTGDELVANGTTISGYDPGSGEELWSIHPSSLRSIPAPVAGDGIAYVTGGTNPIMPIYAVRVGMRDKIEYEVGMEHEGLLWSHGRGGTYMPTPLLYRGRLFIVHHDNRLAVYDAASGELLERKRFSQRGVFSGSPVAVNGKLYLPTEDGLLYVLDASPGLEELAVHDFGEPLMATPAVSEGVLFIRTPSRLVAIDRSEAS